MTVYYLTRGKLKEFHGPITLLDNGKVVLHKDKENKKEITIKRSTIFDTTSSPPVLIRENYALVYLLKIGAVLPEFFMDRQGNIRNKIGELIFQGPSRVSNQLEFLTATSLFVNNRHLTNDSDLVFY